MYRKNNGKNIYCYLVTKSAKMRKNRSNFQVAEVSILFYHIQHTCLKQRYTAKTKFFHGQGSEIHGSRSIMFFINRNFIQVMEIYLVLKLRRILRH